MDSDDAEQTAIIGLIEAARRFDPDRGYQFATYAGYWLRQICQRYGVEVGLPIRMPLYFYWPCHRLTFAWDRLVVAVGERAAREPFERELEAAGVTPSQWADFCAARHVETMSGLCPELRAPFDIEEESPGVVDDLCATEVREEIRSALRTLDARQAEIVSLRYGIGCLEHTLQEVADRLGITRERVRQIQDKAEKKLERVLRTQEWFDLLIRANGEATVMPEQEAVS
jgi:RNA polymerase primary sigma factor/RNA polymerase nonessential primary-like sigma factor